MAMYWTCQYGANHDFGEQCDCKDEEQKRKEFFEKNIKINPKTGQLSLRFDGREAGYATKIVN